ncbi:hypothetical protein [Salinicoccus sp. CNSTN-B1]
MPIYKNKSRKTYYVSLSYIDKFGERRYHKKEGSDAARTLGNMKITSLSTWMKEQSRMRSPSLTYPMTT